ncbi:hypothetical protein BLNAU_2029 [Blattamonas nauphoetae]|uniref:Uncharacterized protein n=1 Tax=Blattamonas nauphoetae TaxID=2049346 RepID=A0ABQ9YH67_9EUKA|nr:hypothetical protein BLNAU_2029 [Blattamonas nauphoetae]
MTSDDTLSNGSQEPPSTIVVNNEPFLYFDENYELSFEDKSAIYCSLVALVNAEYPFDNILQDRAAHFLKSLEPNNFDQRLPNKLVIELVPSSTGSPSGFVSSILTLLSSPHSTLVAAAMSFLHKATTRSSLTIRCRLVESDLISTVLATVQPHTPRIAGNRRIFDNLIWIIFYCLDLASPSSLRELGITSAVDQFNHREMIFQKTQFLVVNRQIRFTLFDLPPTATVPLMLVFPSQFITNRIVRILSEISKTNLINCLSFVERTYDLWNNLLHIELSFKEWKNEGPEVAQCGKRMMQTLFSEGFEDTLEYLMKHDMDGDIGTSIVNYCHSISKLLGVNVK